MMFSAEPVGRAAAQQTAERVGDTTMYAIVKTGGKQYRVEEGATLVVEKIKGDADAQVELTEVLMIGGDGDVKVGAPLLGRREGRGDHQSRSGRGVKINGFTYKTQEEYQPTLWASAVRIPRCELTASSRNAD
jgi:large subunit ribosomal protein L21